MTTRQQSTPTLDRSDHAFAIKCVVLGDAKVGKSWFIARLTGNSMPIAYRPTMVDMSSVRTFRENQLVLVDFWDTPGAHNLESVRLLAYQSTQIFLVCFSVVKPESFVNVKDQWLPEIRKRGPPNCFVLLVGLQSDLRGDEAINTALHQRGEESTTIDQGAELAQRIGAIGYCECSAVSEIGLEAVIDEINATVLDPPKILRHASISFPTREGIEGIEEFRKSFVVTGGGTKRSSDP